MKFRVHTTEILSREDEIEADSKEDALEKARNMWKDEGLVLTGDDFQDVQFEAEQML